MVRSSITQRTWPPRKASLKALIEEAIVDAHDESVQRTAFYTGLVELIVAICRRDR